MPAVSQPPLEGGIEGEIFDQQEFEWLFSENIGEFALRFFAVSSANIFGPGGWAGPDGQPWTPVASCMPRNLVVEISSERLATQVSVAVGGDIRFQMLFGGHSTLVQPIGIPEQAPAWLAIVPVAATQRAAKVAFPNGVVVDARVRDGLAIAVVADDNLDWRSMNLAQHTRIDLGEGFVKPRAPRQEVREECRPPAGMFGPPVELPPAGEQPTDVAAASSAIDAALFGLFDGSQSVEQRAGHVHEPQGVENALGVDGPIKGFGPPGLTLEPTVVALVFASPSTASAELFLAGNSVRADLVLVDGRWKWTAASACDALSRVSPGCSGQLPEPPIEVVGPPR